MSSIKQQFHKNKASWRLSFLEGFCQDASGLPLPWMTYQAIEFLTQNISPNDTIFEFGSGASTLFFASRVKKVIALETRRKWFEIMQEKIAQNRFDNVELILMEDGLENENYENYAKNLAAKGVNFDLIVVDSIKRSKCTQNSINALKINGKLILDDSERPNYGKIFDFMQQKGFIAQNFEGIAPAQLRIKNTTLFSKNATTNLQF